MPTTGADRLPAGLDWVRRKFTEIERELKEIRQLPRGGSGGQVRPSVWAIGHYTAAQQPFTTDGANGWQDINFPPFLASSPDMVSSGSGASRGALVPRDGWYELAFSSRLMYSPGAGKPTTAFVTLRSIPAGMTDDYGGMFVGSPNVSYRLAATWWVPARAGQVLRFQVDSFTTPVTLNGWQGRVRWLAPLNGYSP